MITQTDHKVLAPPVEDCVVCGRGLVSYTDFLQFLYKGEERRDYMYTSSVSVWLHEMGFTHKQFSKGVYFDGHKREDVVEDRKQYIDTLKSYRSRMWTSHSPARNSSCRPVIMIYELQ